MASKEPHCPAEPEFIALICSEPPGHPGDWHYDGIDDITWRQGRHLPGEAAGDGE